MLLEKLRKEGLRRSLSPQTIKTYHSCVQRFLRICHKDLKKINRRDIEDYLFKLIEKGKSGNTLNVHLNSLKFLFEQVLRRKITVNISFSKKPKRLPEFLTQEEVVRLFGEIKNQKHSLMIKLLYSTGMRVSELVSLRVKDFQFDQDYGWIRQGKGRKDRLFIISLKLKEKLLDWIKSNNLQAEDWLFSGQNRSHPSTRTIWIIIKRAAKKAEIAKNVHPHTLRHSFATHLLENGYAVTDVQSLLGHSKIETTLIYTHLSRPKLLKIQSPFDRI